MSLQAGQPILIADLNTFLPEGVIMPYAGRAIPTDYLECDGSAVSRTTYSGLFAKLCPSQTFTVTIASPAVFSATAHGLVAGDKVHFKTTGALPTGLSTNTDYYVISAGLTANAFEVSATRGGAAVNTSGTQSGVHTVYSSNYGKGDGSTTFNLPDLRGYTPYGQKTSDANFDIQNVPNTYVGEKTHQLTTAELASHTHNMGGSFQGPGGNSGGGTPLYNSGSSANTGSAGSDTAHNNMPPYVVVRFIIRAKTYA